MVVAKVLRTGRSQAIRLPKELRVDADTVLHCRRLSREHQSALGDLFRRG